MPLRTIANTALRTATAGATQNVLARVGMSSPQQNLAHNMNQQMMQQQVMQQQIMEQPKQNALAGMPGAPEFQETPQQNSAQMNMGAMGIPMPNPQQQMMPQQQMAPQQQMMPQQQMPPQPAVQSVPRLTPDGYQDILLAGGKIKRINLNTGEPVHVRDTLPEGHQDIELANGKINRINLSTGESQLI